MRDRGIYKILVLLLAVCAISSVGAGAIGVGASAEPPNEFASSVVDNVLPDARTSFEVESSGGQQLSIRLGQTDSEVVDLSYPSFWSAEVRWRAALAAAVVADNDPSITAVDVDPGVPIENADNSLIDPNVIKESPRSATLSAEKTKLGSLTMAEARSQLDSNASALLDQEVAESVSIEPITVDDGSNATAFLIVVSVPKSSDGALNSVMGNAINGMATGLVGGEGDLIDGLAVVVMNDSTPLAASFYAGRAGSSQILAADSVSLPDALSTSIKFENLTGGPATQTTLLAVPPHISVNAGGE